MNLFIDGYNLIFAASHRMPGFDISRTEAARDKLLDLLAKYKSLHPTGRITVFFDGGPEAAHLPRRQMIRGLDIYFSDTRSDADTDIKTTVSHADKPREIRVVTSDMAILAFVKRYGTETTRSEDFLRELEDALRDSALPQDEPMEKYEGGARDEADYWMRQFGLEDDGADKH